MKRPLRMEWFFYFWSGGWYHIRQEKVRDLRTGARPVSIALSMQGVYASSCHCYTRYITSIGHFTGAGFCF